MTVFFGQILKIRYFYCIFLKKNIITCISCNITLSCNSFIRHVVFVIRPARSLKPNPSGCTKMGLICQT